MFKREEKNVSENFFLHKVKNYMVFIDCFLYMALHVSQTEREFETLPLARWETEGLHSRSRLTWSWA